MVLYLSHTRRQLKVNAIKENSRMQKCQNTVSLEIFASILFPETLHMRIEVS